MIKGGASTYTISVSNYQKNGVYKLAQGAESFTHTTTLIIGNGDTNFGSITVNGADFVHRGVTYSLDQVDGNLTLTVSGAKAVTDDLDGNGKADVLLVHSKQGYSGTWLVTGGTPAIEWGNLSTIGKKVELIGVGNVYNSTESPDIFLKNGSTIAAWVMEDGKVKSYKGLYNINSNMNFLGLGDFNGDGATDYLLRSKGGDLGYISSNDNKWHYFKGLGNEWKIAAVGDLNGDGLDDVVLRHDAGFVGTYLTQENGSVKWANLDTLKDDMTIIGTGDFNGDGVDDVLLQKNTGWVGAWLVEDGSVDDFMGICTTKTTIEQIADFNGDGIDDLRVRTDAGDIGIRYVFGADNTSWKYLKSVGDEWETQFSALA